MVDLLMGMEDAGIVLADGDFLEPLLATAAITLEASGPASETPTVMTGVMEAQTIAQAGDPGTGKAPASPDRALPAETTRSAPGAPSVEPYPVATTLLTDPTVVLLTVVLAFPLLLMAVLALRPESGFRTWFATSLWDFQGLFSGIGNRRRQIHDKPYLDRVLQAEKKHEESMRRRSRRPKRAGGTGPAPSDPPKPPDNEPPQP